MTMNENPVTSALRKTKELLSQEGVWTNDEGLVLYGKHHCLLTAIGTVAPGRSFQDVERVARAILHQVVGAWSLAEWNDSHTLPEVLQALDDAIELSKAS